MHKVNFFVIFLFAGLVLFVSALSDQTNTNVNHYFSKDAVSSSNIKKHLTVEYTTKNGKKVFVFDGLVSYALMMAVRTFFSVNDDWRYVHFDKYETDASASYDHGNGIPWRSWQNPTVLSGTRISHIFEAMSAFASQQLNVNSTSNDKRRFHLTEIYSAISRRGDITQLHRESNSTREGFTAVMYTNTIWRKNSYGEILFYEDDSDFDIFAAISPRCGRVIVWDSSIRYITRPPSITELQGQYMIFAQFNSDPKIVFEKRTHFDQYLDDLKESRKKRFVCTDNVDQVPHIDMEKHLVLKRRSKAGDVVAVFDDLFNKTDLDALRTFSVKYGKYYYDDHLDSSSDNVQWIAAFNIKKLVHSRIWPIVHQVATYVSGKDTWYPYDVACNLIRSADHTRFHLDTSHPKELEMTFLLYLNPNWTAANYGETAFMEKNYDSPDNDYVAEVVPRYGRAVIFDGNFPHSAHPPAPNYSGPRYTFVVKLSINKLEAIKKAFREEGQHSPAFAIQTMREIQADPQLFSSKHKISSVANYLHTKQVKQLIDQKPKTEDGFEDAMSQNSESDNDLTNSVGFEGELSLSKEHGKLMKKMMKHHRVSSDKLNAHSEEVEKQLNAGGKSDTSMIFSQDQRIRSWKKRCGKDGDCLDDFFELFLEQRSELNRRVTRDILAMI